MAKKVSFSMPSLIFASLYSDRSEAIARASRFAASGVSISAAMVLRLYPTLPAPQLRSLAAVLPRPGAGSRSAPGIQHRVGRHGPQPDVLVLLRLRPEWLRHRAPEPHQQRFLVLGAVAVAHVLERDRHLRFLERYGAGLAGDLGDLVLLLLEAELLLHFHAQRLPPC